MLTPPTYFQGSRPPNPYDLRPVDGDVKSCSFTLTVRRRQVFNLSFLLTQTDRQTRQYRAARKHRFVPARNYIHH